MRRRSRARKLTTVHNSGLVDEYRYRRTSSPSCQSRKRARICQVRAELSTIRPRFHARSASARAFAKQTEPKQVDEQTRLHRAKRSCTTRRTGSAKRRWPTSRDRSDKRVRICQMRAELSTIGPLFRARSASARAFAKTGGANRTGRRWADRAEPVGGRTEQAEGGRTGPNRWANRTGRRWADRPEPVGEANRLKGPNQVEQRLLLKFAELAAVEDDWIHFTLHFEGMDA
ncbi:hypothetical protein A3L23_01375 [Rhodococcoides fascians D188]|nr:hypothetical protein A3L23_01375 [Rhodococcus fascians D188]